MRSTAELHDSLMVLNMFLTDKYGHVSFLGTNMLSACPTQPTIWWVEKPLIIKVWFSRTNLGWQENKINLAGKNVQPFRGGWHLCISYRRTCFSSTFCVFSELAFVVGVAFLWWERVWSLQNFMHRAGIILAKCIHHLFSKPDSTLDLAHCLLLHHHYSEEKKWWIKLLISLQLAI